MTTELTGRVHNAKACTFDGSDCWVGSLNQAGRFLDTVGEYDTAKIAVAAVRRELRARGFAKAEIEVRDNVRRHYVCHCCGESFTSDKPRDPQRDTGYGTCTSCRDMVARSWAKHGFPGVTDLTSAYARLDRYA
jgi:hypothetical protein